MRVHVTESVNDPSSAPQFVGAHWINTTNGKMWRAKGTSSVADWVEETTDTGITQLTGDVMAGPGSGSQAATLATVNSNVGSFTNASLTVNAKGLITAASSGTTPVTSVGATAPITSTGGATPNIGFTTPGATTNIMYNDGGVPGADANFTWNKTTKINTITQNALGLTSSDGHLLTNTTPAVAGSSGQQVSPRMVWEGQGWKTIATAASQSVKMGVYVQPTQSTSFPFGTWHLQKNVNAAGWTTLLSVVTGDASELTTASLNFSGKTFLTHNNTNSTHNISDVLTFANSSGSYTHTKYTFAGTPKYAVSVQNTGFTRYIAGGSNPVHEFHVGSSTGATNYVIQIYGAGIYNAYNNYNTGVVTAGQADTGTTTKLSSYGSFATKGTTVTTSTYQVVATDQVIYLDPSYAEVCTGTPSVTDCTTYVSEGTCTPHLPCVWSAGTACSTYSGSSLETCETGHTGCVWESLSCSSADNSDETSCTDLNTGYGGTCAWDTSTCPALSDGGGDGTACATEPRCSYDSGTGACSGNLCQGSYYSGTCAGTVWGAGCSGTATCSGYGTSGTCAAESGCNWVTGQTVTLPAKSSANRSNTSRWHDFVYVGEGPGTATIVPYSGDSMFMYSSFNLYKKGDRVRFHHHTATGACSQFPTQTPCELVDDCTWQAAVVCSSYSSQEDCEANLCSWDSELMTCSGAGSAAQCVGSFTIVDAWVPHNIERGESYVQKTANYTLTNIDDVVDFTSGSNTATLPDAVKNFYRKFTVINSGTGTITMATTSSQTINGASAGTFTLIQGESLVFYSNGSNWVTL